MSKALPFHRPRDINVRMLPPQLKMLIRIMGMGPALMLVKERGGTPLRVPAKVTVDHWLMGTVGPVAFAALVAEMARVDIELPKYDSVARQWRHQQVYRMRARGLHLDLIALRTGYTRRHVINILQAEDCGQLDLFRAAQPGAQPGAEADDAEDGWAANDPFGELAR